MPNTASTTPISTYNITLQKGTGTSTVTYSKLVDIKDFPNLGGEPNMLECTTLSDAMQKYVKGIKKLDALSFTCNYTSGDYSTLAALADTDTKFAVYFGADGVDGKYYFSGKSSVYVKGAGVDNVVEMIFTVAPSTEITTTAPTA